MFEDLTIKSQDAVLQQREIKVLKLLRTRPEPGKPVMVQVVSGNDVHGTLELPTEVWMALNKLLQKANESNAKEGMPVALKVIVAGVEPLPEPAKQLEARESGPIARPAMESHIEFHPLKNVFPAKIENQEQGDADLKAVKEEEKLLANLARTLKEEK